MNIIGKWSRCLGGVWDSLLGKYQSMQSVIVRVVGVTGQRVQKMKHLGKEPDQAQLEEGSDRVRGC